MLEFYDTWIQPSSSQRRKFSMHMRSPLAKVDDSVKLDERNKRVEDALEFKTSLRISRGAVPVKKMEDYMA